ncbi:MAG: FHA domain-containing protein [Anaerolineales bacterium]|nr:FHA domain-containing protein [Anaerolineales bacterium]
MSAPVLLILRLALTAALYAFLAWGLWVLWSDLRRSSRSLAAPQAPPLSLARGEAGEQPAGRFTSAEVIAGRDPACDLQVQDKTISARHARLSYHHGQWWVEDLRSRNGTFLNQEKVVEPLVMAAGDQLRLGQVVFLVEIGESKSD